MNDFNLTNPDELCKSDFIEKSEVEGNKIIEHEEVKDILLKTKSLIEKSENEKLSNDEQIKLDFLKSELSLIDTSIVLSDNMTREKIYFLKRENIEKSEENKSILKKEIALSRLRESFEKGEISEEALEKAQGHKYFKREGTPGNYKYYYTEAQYKKEKGEKNDEENINYSIFENVPVQGRKIENSTLKKLDKEGKIDWSKNKPSSIIGKSFFFKKNENGVALFIRAKGGYTQQDYFVGKINVSDGRKSDKTSKKEEPISKERKSKI